MMKWGGGYSPQICSQGGSVTLFPDGPDVHRSKEISIMFRSRWSLNITVVLGPSMQASQSIELNIMN